MYILQRSDKNAFHAHVRDNISACLHSDDTLEPRSIQQQLQGGG
jgi:hypothetical protein